MNQPKWIHVIIRALYALGGSAPYSRLKPEIESRAERTLTPKWHQTVEGTIEEYSSDSIRGKKPSNFKGSDKDVFRKVGHGHWAIRDESNQYVQEAIGESRKPSVNAPEEPTDLIFVREHWRTRPGDRIDVADLPDDERLSPVAAWCTNLHLEVELASGTKISCPIVWFPRLLAATPVQRSSVKLTPQGLSWPEIDEDITIGNLLFGIRGLPLIDTE